MPNFERDDNYGTLAFGVRTQMWGMDADFGANASVGQEGGNHATVFVNVGKRF